MLWSHGCVIMAICLDLIISSSLIMVRRTQRLLPRWQLIRRKACRWCVFLPRRTIGGRGSLSAQTLRFLDALGLYDILLPLDCDEFLVLRGESREYLCAQDAVLGYLATLRGRETILEVKENLINVLAAPGKFWPFPYQKVFFAGGQCGVVDHGSHQDISGRGRAAEETRLAYVHFHHRAYAQQVKASLEKLRPFVDVEDRAALAAFRGPGWHLVSHILRGEAPYTGMMKPGPGAVEVTGLLALFRELGIDPLFTER